VSDWASDVLAFWFRLDPQTWWKADPIFDEQIRDRFDELHEEKRALPADYFLSDHRTALAAVILFDQFPRNMHRRHADQFATDALALSIAKSAIKRGYDEALSPLERGFLYMPFQHSEDLDDQQRSLQLFTALRDEYQLDFARKHHDVIARFGRFPHRNAILGRAPRSDEIAAGDVVPW